MTWSLNRSYVFWKAWMRKQPVGPFSIPRVHSLSLCLHYVGPAGTKVEPWRGIQNKYGETTTSSSTRKTNTNTGAQGLEIRVGTGISLRWSDSVTCCSILEFVWVKPLCHPLLTRFTCNCVANSNVSIRESRILEGLRLFFHVFDVMLEFPLKFVIRNYHRYSFVCLIKGRDIEIYKWFLTIV